MLFILKPKFVSELIKYQSLHKIIGGFLINYFYELDQLDLCKKAVMDFKEVANSEQIMCVKEYFSCNLESKTNIVSFLDKKKVKLKINRKDYDKYKGVKKFLKTSYLIFSWFLIIFGSLSALETGEFGYVGWASAGILLFVLYLIAKKERKNK